MQKTLLQVNATGKLLLPCCHRAMENSRNSLGEFENMRKPRALAAFLAP